MNNFYTLLTNAGINAIIQARASGAELKLTKIAVGDGNITPTQEATALVSEKYRFNINSILQDTDNPNYLIIEGVIPSNIGGFTANEVAIYTDTNVLFAIGNLPSTYKPLLEEGSAKDLTIKVFLEVTNADSINLKVDDSVVLATRSFVLKELKRYALLNGDETQKFKVADAIEENEAVNKKQLDTVNTALTNLTTKSVTLDTTQTITGKKTFTQDIVANITGKSNITTFDAGSNLNSAGYIKLANGLILQWKQVSTTTTSTTGTTITFPIAFSSNCFGVLITDLGGSCFSYGVNTISKTNCKIYSINPLLGQLATGSGFMFAIGK